MIFMIGIILIWVVALGTIGGWLGRFLYDLYLFVLAARVGHLTDLKKTGGDWAVVTGAGAGIGRGYTIALARKGLNVCLIGRTEKKLKEVATMVEEKYQVKTKVIVHDFSKITNNDAELLKTALGDLFDQVGVLINNVGIMGGDDNFVTSFIHNMPNPIDYGREMVTVNVQSVILMTGLFLPSFIQRNKGIVVNVASLAGLFPMTGHTVYSATKAFVDFFTESIRQESAGTKVIIQTVNPCSVRTDLIPRFAFDNLPSIISPSPERFARNAVNSIGLQERTAGCLSHNIQTQLFTLIDSAFPKSVSSWMRYQSMLKFKAMHLNVKKQL